MTRITFTLAIALLAGSFSLAQESKPSSSTTVTSPTFHNVNCPVMGKPVSTKLFVETEFGRIYMCCKACTKRIKADPAGTHKAAYPTTTKVGNKTCPISGEALDDKSPKVTIQGYEIGFCCQSCAKTLAENVVVFLAKLTNPAVVDVGNATCPITGKAVQNNAFCLVGNDLVHLSSPECVEDVKKDPKKALEKAKEIKAAEKKPADEKKPGPRDDGGAR